MATAAPAAGQPSLPLREHVGRTLKLAGPVMASRAGLLVMTSVDTIMCGRAGAEELAYYGISLAPSLSFMLVGIGLMMGVVVLTAQTDGAGRPHECGRIWRLGLINGLIAGGLFGLAMLPGESLLLLLGQNPEISRGGGEALRMFAFGMPAILAYTSTTLFLEGIGRSTPGMVVMIAANLVNLALNWVLMFGPFEMGATGAVLATSITRWFMFAAIAGYVLLMVGRDDYGVFAPMRGAWGFERKLARLGWPLAISFLMEHGAFFAAATFAGWLGQIPLAGYQVTLNVMALIYMLAIGLSTATGVRVGNAVGRLDREGLARAGWVGLGIGVLIMLALTPVLWFAAPWIVAIYTDDPAVAAVAIPGLGIAAWILVVDASQGIMVGALRGAADIWVTMGLQAIAFWVIGIPLCYWLGHVQGFGVAGLLWGLFAALLASAVFLTGRFQVISRRDVRPF
ncbi:MAG: MATE family efflux transporter [Geminicoccaceae bacterium]|nr:MATE family efflux transporter [Geminicoccaceae bacterium]